MYRDKRKAENKTVAFKAIIKACASSFGRQPTSTSDTKLLFLK